MRWPPDSPNASRREQRRAKQASATASDLRDVGHHPGRRARPEAFSALRGQFRRRAVEKVYLALVEGRLEPPEGRIELPLGGRGSLTKPWRSARDGRALPALTSYRELWAGGDCSLLEVRIETGVRYQIRAHLAAIGHPLRGDTAYGGATWGSPAGRDAGATLPRHLLHAWKLGFRDPVDDSPTVATAPLPDDARLALERLGASLAATLA